MIIVALKEAAPETRVAITPNSAKTLIKSGHTVLVEEQAGLLSGFSDQDYRDAGASVIKKQKELLSQADVLVCLNEPAIKPLSDLKQSALIITHLDDEQQQPLIQFCLKSGNTLFSMNKIPRTSRAQSMDSLSSQANLAGYRAVIEAVSHYQKVVPMMMTAAGMIHPAKVLILGAGVAGLQAIATAKRLGAVVYAFDVRRAAKEQVESLGAEFIEVPIEEQGENASGYAQEMSEAYQKQQAALIDDYAKRADIVITTALIPGRPAPRLLQKHTVEAMKSGAVIVDMATARGGNCELSQRDTIIQINNVTLIGFSNLPGLVPATASELYANNLVHTLKLLTSDTQLVFNPEDDIIQSAILCHEGRYHPFSAKEKTHA